MYHLVEPYRVGFSSGVRSIGSLAPGFNDMGGHPFHEPHTTPFETHLRNDHRQQQVIRT